MIETSPANEVPIHCLVHRDQQGFRAKTDQHEMIQALSSCLQDGCHWCEERERVMDLARKLQALMADGGVILCVGSVCCPFVHQAFGLLESQNPELLTHCLQSGHVFGGFGLLGLTSQ